MARLHNKGIIISDKNPHWGVNLKQASFVEWGIKPLGLSAFGAIGCLSKKLNQLSDGFDLWLLLHGSSVFSESWFYY